MGGRPGGPLPPPPHARWIPSAVIALGCNAETVSMAHLSTDGLGVAGQADPCPPPPLRARHFLALQLRSITDVAEEKWQRLHRWPGAGGPSPPLRACRFSGTATALGCNAEAVSMAPSPTDGLGIAERADPCPPPVRS
jgi:hypothetical protein